MFIADVIRVLYFLTTLKEGVVRKKSRLPVYPNHIRALKAYTLTHTWLINYPLGILLLFCYDHKI